jgi:hypothetical protein
MQLHELPWEATYSDALRSNYRKAVLPYCNVFHRRDEDIYSIFAPNIYLGVAGAGHREWLKVDALTAQCILHELADAHSRATGGSDAPR